MTELFNTAAGEELAWELLRDLDPGGVRDRAGVELDAGAGMYRLVCLGQELEIDAGLRSIRSYSSTGKALLEELGPHVRLSALRYLVHCPPGSWNQDWANPSDLSGGRIFDWGSHVLPLQDWAESVQQEPSGAARVCRNLGGRLEQVGDLGMLLHPFPKFTLLFVAWFADQEFSAEGRVLVDQVWNGRIPGDIIWATAMFSLKMFMTRMYA